MFRSLRFVWQLNRRINLARIILTVRVEVFCSRYISVAFIALILGFLQVQLHEL